MAKWKLGSIIALLVGPFLIVINYFETTQKHEIARVGIATVAVPTAKITRRGRRGGRTYKLELEYPVQSGGTRSERVSVSRELYEKAESQPLVQIKYSAKDPSKLIIVGEPLENPGMYIVGALFVVLGAAGTWYYFIRRPQAVPQPVGGTTSTSP
jgi:hypothetical protein